MKGIKKGYEGYEVEDVTKKEAEPVYSAKNEIIIKKPDDPVGPFRDVDQVYEANNG